MESKEILNIVIEFKNHVYSKVRVLYSKTLKTVVSVNIQAKNMWNVKHTVMPTMSVFDRIMSDDCHNKVVKQFDRVRQIAKFTN